VELKIYVISRSLSQSNLGREPITISNYENLSYCFMATISTITSNAIINTRSLQFMSLTTLLISLSCSMINLFGLVSYAIDSCSLTSIAHFMNLPHECTYKIFFQDCHGILIIWYLQFFHSLNNWHRPRSKYNLPSILHSWTSHTFFSNFDLLLLNFLQIVTCIQQILLPQEYKLFLLLSWK